MQGLIQSFPAAQQAQLAQLADGFSNFIETLKEALAGSIGHVFSLGIIVMLAALVTTLFLPVIDLHRAHKRPVVEELGVELEAEMGLAEPEDEPQL